MDFKKNILFLCTHNSCRSQIAQAITQKYHKEFYNAFSAGTERTKVNEYAIMVLKELDIDTSKLFSKTVDSLKDIHFDIVVTVCDNAKENCPFFPATKSYHKSFKDPSDFKGSENEIIQAFRKTREEIKDWLDDFFKSEGKSV